MLAYAPILAAAALLALVPLRYHESGSTMRVITEGMLFAAYTVAFNIIFGSTGQLFLCTGALAGVGGFMSAIFADRVGLPMVASIAVGVAMAATIGGILSWISVKRDLGTIFIGIVTLAFSLSFDSLLLGRSDLFGGDAGLRVEAGTDTVLRDRVPPYYIFLGLVVVYLVVFRLLQRSRTGWAFRALRDDTVAAELAGVDVAHYRVYAGSARLGDARTRRWAVGVLRERADRALDIRVRSSRRARDRHVSRSAGSAPCSVQSSAPSPSRGSTSSCSITARCD